MLFNPKRIHDVTTRSSTLTLTEFAKAAGIHRHTARKWAESGTITAQRSGRGWEVPVSEVARMTREVNDKVNAHVGALHAVNVLAEFAIARIELAEDTVRIIAQEIDRSERGSAAYEAAITRMRRALQLVDEANTIQRVAGEISDSTLAAAKREITDLRDGSGWVDDDNDEPADARASADTAGLTDAG